MENINNIKIKEIGKQIEKEKTEEYSENIVNKKLLNSNYNDISKMQMKTKIIQKEIIKNIDIFPNGNILIYSSVELYIFNSKTFKPIFKYKIENYITNIIILSDDTLLINISEEFDSLTILNITNQQEFSEKKFNIKYNYHRKNIYYKVIEKLNNNRILFYYKFYDFENGFDEEYDDESFCLVFYKYNNEKRMLEFEYEEPHTYINCVGHIIPYINLYSFINYGFYTKYIEMDPEETKYIIGLYSNKKYNNILYIINQGGIEYDEKKILDCFILQKKYLIAILKDCIIKYEIKEDKSEKICQKEYNINNYCDYLLKDESHFYLIYQKKENENYNDYYDYIFLELDENIKEVKEIEKKLFKFEKIFAYDKKIYLLSTNVYIYS